MFKKIIEYIKTRIEMERVQMIQQKCKHEYWEMDNQIRVIRCKNCKKTAFVQDYVDLFKKEVR